MANGGFQFSITKKYGKEVMYIKKRGKFRKKLKILFYIIFITTISLAFGNVFASVSEGTLGSHILGQRDKVKVSAITYYGLNMGSYSNLDDAKITSNVVIQAGGGGYIWQAEEQYIVLGSVYKKEKDCNTVVENIAENYKASVYKIKLKKCKFVVEDIARGERSEIENIVEFCNETYERLYDLSIDYDTGKISNIAVSASVNSLKSEVGGKKTQIFNLYTKYNSNKLKLIHDTYITIEDTLELLINQMLTVENNQHLVKYAFMEVLCNCYKLRNNLQ